MNIDQTLAERGARYGSFADHARITWNIKRAFIDSPNWNKLDDDMKEALDMVANKAGRILNGDPWYHDSWHDIVGYVKLVADRLQEEQQETQQLDLPIEHPLKHVTIREPDTVVQCGVPDVQADVRPQA